MRGWVIATSSNFIIDAGSLFEAIVTATNDDGSALDLTNMEVYAQMRLSPYSNTAWDFDASVYGDPLNGEILLTLPADRSANIRARRYLYDVEIRSTTDATYVKRVLQGLVTISPNITQIP